jgi:uncharacterized lipoprotein YddW (UPF0748 family)
MNPPGKRYAHAITCVIGLTLAACSVAALHAEHAAERQGEVRALWVTRATLSSPTAIAQMVQAADAAGFNTLIVQVRGRGDAYYKSSYEPPARELAIRPDFDPLAEVVARARPAGLRVHAWININLVSSAADLPTSRQHVLYRHPEWLMVPRDLAAEMLRTDPRNPDYVGRLARWTRAHLDQVEGLYTSPLHVGAAVHVANIAAEIASNYAVDGIHVDYARFPNADFDYSPPALQQFKQTVRPQLTDTERQRLDAQELIDPLTYPKTFNARWMAFRQSRMTALLMRVRTAVKAVNPAIVISAAVVPDLTVASESRMQDWRTWLEQSLVDIVCPMAYTQDIELFARQIETVLDYAGDRPVWAGVGAYRLTPTATLQYIDAARRRNAEGIVLFSYDALVSPPNSVSSLAALGRAAFRSVPSSSQ